MRRRNSFGALGGGIFLLFLALAFFISQLSGHLFLPVLFVGLAFSSLLGSIGSFNPKGIYGGLQGFLWLLGLAFCFLVGFWPWILVVTAFSVILGALSGPLVAGIAGAGFLGAANTFRQPQQQPQQPYYQPTPQPEPQPYQQGYQTPPAAQAAPESYQEGGKQYQYPSQQYEQPQAQYPQELPPQHQ